MQKPNANFHDKPAFTNLKAFYVDYLLLTLNVNRSLLTFKTPKKAWTLKK